jgi:hypothetical protein
VDAPFIEWLFVRSFDEVQKRRSSVHQKIWRAKRATERRRRLSRRKNEYSDSGQAEYDENDPFLQMAASILSEQRASKNDLKSHFIRHKQKEGFVVEQVESDKDLMAEGKGIVARGKQLSREQYCKALLSASPLTRSGFNRVSEALRRGERVSEQEKASYEKTNLELFYREETSEGLIELDDRRRFRRKVTLYETAFGILA